MKQDRTFILMHSFSLSCSKMDNLYSTNLLHYYRTMKNKITLGVLFVGIAIILTSCDSSSNSGTPVVPKTTVSPTEYSNTWDGLLVRERQGEPREEDNISIVLTPFEKIGIVNIYTADKKLVTSTMTSGGNYKDYELTFPASGFFTCRIYVANDDGSIFNTRFQVDEGYYYYSGDVIHLMSKYNYKREYGFEYRVDGFWSIVECGPRRLRLKHQDTFGTMDLHPLK